MSFELGRGGRFARIAAGLGIVTASWTDVRVGTTVLLSDLLLVCSLVLLGPMSVLRAARSRALPGLSPIDSLL